MIKKPKPFHLRKVKMSLKLGVFSDTYEAHFEIRELMRIYQVLKGRGCNKQCDKVEAFLNSIAKADGYPNFDVTEKITLDKDAGVDNDWNY